MTVYEVLENAQYNLKTIGLTFSLSNHPIFAIGMSQLKNAITALGDGKSPDDAMEQPNE